jgi:hypothetical protein
MRSLGGRKRNRPIQQPEADERAWSARSDEREDSSESDSEGVVTKLENHRTERADEMQVDYGGLNDGDADAEKDQSV